MTKPLFDEIRKEIDLGQINANHPIRAKIDAAEAASLRLKKENEEWANLYDKTNKTERGITGAAFISAHNRMVIDWTAAIAERDARIAELENALRPYVLAQSRMLDRWSEGDDNVRARLWADLHLCEENGRKVLDG